MIHFTVGLVGFGVIVWLLFDRPKTVSRAGALLSGLAVLWCIGLLIHHKLPPKPINHNASVRR